VQLGGSDPNALAACARICADAGFDEINLNVAARRTGCRRAVRRLPDGRAGAGRDSVAAMKAAAGIPVTVKCRIGIDDQDPEEALDALARPPWRLASMP